VNLVEQLVLLAEEIETADPIDWGMLEINDVFNTWVCQPGFMISS
jgi:hypothetical protein